MQKGSRPWVHIQETVILTLVSTERLNSRLVYAPGNSVMTALPTKLPSQFGGTSAENQRHLTKTPLPAVYRLLKSMVPTYHSTCVHWPAGQNTVTAEDEGAVTPFELYL